MSSIYDGSTPYEGGSSTIRAKTRLMNIIKEQLLSRNFKSWILCEVPATFTNPLICYNLDIGVLFRNKSEFDFYHFFAVEVDDSTHRTYIHDNKDDNRDEAFLVNKGIVTCRIPLEKIIGENNIKNDKELFDQFIYSQILPAYIIMPAESIKQQLWAEINRKFAIELKENAYTSCSKCDHKSIHHDLTGCQFRFTNKTKLLCTCVEPFFRSNS